MRNVIYLSIATVRNPRGDKPIGREFIEVVPKFLVILHIFIIVIIPLDSIKMHTRHWLTASFSAAIIKLYIHTKLYWVSSKYQGCFKEENREKTV